jgi:putative transposase
MLCYKPGGIMGDAYTRLYVHLVWATWNRQPFITEEIEPLLYRSMIAKATEMGCVTIAAGGYTEHAHILLKIPTVHSIALIVRALKGASSFLVSHRERAAPFRWQSGYGAFTLRDTDVPVVKRYIQRQKEHHRSDTIHIEWETSHPPSNEWPGY